MSGFSLINGVCVYIEIGAGSLRALDGQESFEFALERQSNGRLTPSCKVRLAAAFRGFRKRRNWQLRVRAYCGIASNGVSLRRLVVPSAAREEFQRLVLLQIEKEFPLPPDEMAWGYRAVAKNGQGDGAVQELLVIAVRRELIEDYAEVLAQCGLNPVFTLAALARSRLCQQPLGNCALLDVGSGSAEAIVFENGIPTSIRAFVSNGNEETAVLEAAAFLSRSGQGVSCGRLFLSGRTAPTRRIIETHLPSLAVLEVPEGGNRSAALLGLKKAVEQEAGNLICFQSKSQAIANGNSGAVRKWVAAAVGLAFCVVLLPYAQAIVLKPLLARKLSALNAQSGQLAVIDEERDFLQFLKQNQPPYLDVLFLCAKAAPQGARFDSVTMNRRGELAMRGSMRNADQVSEFRSKLIESGFFSSVSVEDQSPTPDRQKLNVRIAAQWRSFEERAALAVGPDAKEIEQAKHDKPSGAGNPKSAKAPATNSAAGSNAPAGASQSAGRTNTSAPPPTSNAPAALPASKASPESTNK